MNILQRKSPGHDEEYRILLERSIEELKLKTAAHESLFQLGAAEWSADLEKGTIIFTSPKGFRAICSLQIIGTINLQDDTWLWAWNNSSIGIKLQEHARAVKEYGEQHHIKSFITPKFKCTEATAWEFTAMACKLAKAEGAYRGPAGNTRVFMTYSNVRLST